MCGDHLTCPRGRRIPDPPPDFWGGRRGEGTGIEGGSTSEGGRSRTPTLLFLIREKLKAMRGVHNSSCSETVPQRWKPAWKVEGKADGSG